MKFYKSCAIAYFKKLIPTLDNNSQQSPPMQQRQPVVSTIPTFPAPERRVMLLLIDFSLFWLRTKLTGNSRNKHNIWRRCKMLNSTCRSFSFFSAASLSLFCSRLFNLSGTRSPCHNWTCINHYQTC